MYEYTQLYFAPFRFVILAASTINLETPQRILFNGIINNTSWQQCHWCGTLIQTMDINLMILPVNIAMSVGQFHAAERTDSTGSLGRTWEINLTEQ